VLRVKRNHLEMWSKSRQRSAARYEALFKQANLLGRVTLPTVTAENRHVYNQYVIRALRRDQLRAFLHEQGVGTEIYYPSPLHLQGCYKDLGHGDARATGNRSRCRPLARAG